MGNAFAQMINIPQEMADGARDFSETGGEDILFGPMARSLYDSQTPPTMTLPGAIHNLPSNTLLPKQAAIGDPLSTSSQYQTRFGATQNHF